MTFAACYIHSALVPGCTIVTHHPPIGSFKPSCNISCHEQVICHVIGWCLRLALLRRTGGLVKANLGLPLVPPPRNGPTTEVRHMRASRDLQARLSQLSGSLSPDSVMAATTQSGWLLQQVQARRTPVGCLLRHAEPRTLKLSASR